MRYQVENGICTVFRILRPGLLNPSLFGSIRTSKILPPGEEPFQVEIVP